MESAAQAPPPPNSVPHSAGATASGVNPGDEKTKPRAAPGRNGSKTRRRANRRREGACERSHEPLRVGVWERRRGVQLRSVSRHAMQRRAKPCAVGASLRSPGEAGRACRRASRERLERPPTLPHRRANGARTEGSHWPPFYQKQGSGLVALRRVSAPLAAARNAAPLWFERPHPPPTPTLPWSSRSSTFKPQRLSAIGPSAASLKRLGHNALSGRVWATPRSRRGRPQGALRPLGGSRA